MVVTMRRRNTVNATTLAVCNSAVWWRIEEVDRLMRAHTRGRLMVTVNRTDLSYAHITELKFMQDSDMSGICGVS
jgi:hypothetical protein